MLLSHGAKYRSLLPSLALIVHLIDSVEAGTGRPVSRAAAERAVAWGEYLQGHARRLYPSVTDMARVAAALLAVRAGTAGDPPCGSASTRGSWRAGMTDRAAVLRRRPRAPDVAPGVNRPTNSLAMHGGFSPFAALQPARSPPSHQRTRRHGQVADCRATSGAIEVEGGGPRSPGGLRTPCPIMDGFVESPRDR